MQIFCKSDPNPHNTPQKMLHQDAHYTVTMISDEDMNGHQTDKEQTCCDSDMEGVDSENNDRRVVMRSTDSTWEIAACSDSVKEKAMIPASPRRTQRSSKDAMQAMLCEFEQFVHHQIPKQLEAWRTALLQAVFVNQHAADGMDEHASDTPTMNKAFLHAARKTTCIQEAIYSIDVALRHIAP